MDKEKMMAPRGENWARLTSLNPFRERYIYMDVDEDGLYMADRLFIRHKVTVKFGPEFGRPEGGYILVMCTVAKKDREKFLDALSELPNAMLLTGHSNYCDECRKVMGTFDQIGKAGA